MKTVIRRVFVFALLTASFGLTACYDHPYRGDHGPHGGHYQGH